MKTIKIKIIALLTGILFSATAMAQNNAIGEYVNKMVKDPEVETATFAISVYNISKGQQIYDYNANKSMIPASIVKIVTTSVGFDKLGKNFRFKTSLGYSGEVDKRGVLQGNVYIVGGGDPILGSYRYKQTAIDSVFAAWILVKRCPVIRICRIDISLGIHYIQLIDDLLVFSSGICLHLNICLDII